MAIACSRSAHMTGMTLSRVWTARATVMSTKWREHCNTKGPTRFSQSPCSKNQSTSYLKYIASLVIHFTNDQ